MNASLIERLAAAPRASNPRLARAKVEHTRAILKAVPRCGFEPLGVLA